MGEKNPQESLYTEHQLNTTVVHVVRETTKVSQG